MKTLQFNSITTGLPPQLGANDVIALDLELSGLKEGQLHRPFGHLTSLAGCYDGENVFIIFQEDEVQEFLNRIEKATWVFHNSTFDIGHLRRWAIVNECENMRDTLLIERLMFSNYYDDFDLKSLVRRYLKCYMPKDVRKEFINHTGAMTQSQIEYAALDVIGTWHVDKEQQKIISKHDMELWKYLYNPHVWTTLELGGFPLDVDAWMALADSNQAIVDRISEALGAKYSVTSEKIKYTKRRPTGKNPTSEAYLTKYAEWEQSKVVEKVFTPFNPNSHAQVKQILLDKYKLALDSTDDDHIRPYYESNDFIRDILDYRKAEKQVSTYGIPFLKNVEDGKIFTSLNIGLAETGRDSSSSPNLQNIPKDKARRKCFVAGAGWKLTLWDYSGQEACIWAYITGDPIFAEIINSGKKLYIEVARLAFGEEVKKGTHRYDIVKALVLGMMYGLTPYGFARDNDVDIETAESMYNAVFEAFPATGKFIQEKQSRNTGVAKTILGRVAHLHPYDRQWKNNALNSPMQGTGGDMIKLAMRNLRRTDFYKEHHPKGEVEIILQVHDEIICRVTEPLAAEWNEIHRKTMIETAEKLHPGIRGGVSGGMMDNWAEKD